MYAMDDPLAHTIKNPPTKTHVLVIYLDLENFFFEIKHFGYRKPFSLYYEKLYIVELYIYILKL